MNFTAEDIKWSRKRIIPFYLSEEIQIHRGKYEYMKQKLIAGFPFMTAGHKITERFDAEGNRDDDLLVLIQRMPHRKAKDRKKAIELLNELVSIAKIIGFDGYDNIIPEIQTELEERLNKTISTPIRCVCADGHTEKDFVRVFNGNDCGRHSIKINYKFPIFVEGNCNYGMFIIYFYRKV